MNGHPIFTMSTENISETGQLAEPGTAYLYRSAKRGPGQGRWRVTRREENMSSDIANIKSTSAAELPTEAGLGFLIYESGSWLLDSTIKATALETSSTVAPPDRNTMTNSREAGISEEAGTWRSSGMMNDTYNDLLVHNPLFWHNPSRIWKLFVTDLAEGNVAKGFFFCSATMFWKTKMLLQLTFGFWTDELIQHMQVETRSEKLDLNLHDDDDKYESLLGDIGNSHSMIWLLVGLAPFLKAGEDLNRAIIFVPPRYQCKFVTPYWIRRAQFILFSLMYVCFLGTIILPWAYPFVPASVPKHTPNFWDDDDDYYDDDNDDKGWLARTKYKKQWSSFGTYYMTHGDAFYVLAATYIAWAVFALANAVLDFVKDRGTRRARLAPFQTTHRRIAHPAYTVPSEISKAKARKGEGAQESGVIELSPIHNIAENNVGMMTRVVLSSDSPLNSPHADLLGTYKLQAARFNGSPLFAMKLRTAEEAARPSEGVGSTFKSTATAVESRARKAVAATGAAVKSTATTIHSHGRKAVAATGEAVKAVTTASVAGGVGTVAGNAKAVAAATVRSAKNAGHGAAALASFSRTESTFAYLFRTFEREDGDGRWRVAHGSYDGPSVDVLIETALPAELPTDPGIEFLILVRGESSRTSNPGAAPGLENTPPDAEWQTSQIVATDPTTVAPRVLVLAGDTSLPARVKGVLSKPDNDVESLLSGTFHLQNDRQVNGHPLYVRTEVPAFLYRSTDTAQEGGRWRVTRAESEMNLDGGELKTLAPHLLPNSSGAQWAVLEGTQWRLSKVTARVRKEPRAPESGPGLTVVLDGAAGSQVRLKAEAPAQPNSTAFDADLGGITAVEDDGAMSDEDGDASASTERANVMIRGHSFATNKPSRRRSTMDVLGAAEAEQVGAESNSPAGAVVVAKQSRRSSMSDVLL